MTGGVLRRLQVGARIVSAVWSCRSLNTLRHVAVHDRVTRKRSVPTLGAQALDLIVSVEIGTGLHPAFSSLEHDGDALLHGVMAKLYFHYSTMNAGKSTLLLQAAYNYRERGMDTYLLTAQFDNRAGDGRIGSRIGIDEAADTFASGDDLFEKIEARLAAGPVACVFVDEAQFLEKEQVWQLARVVDDLNVPVMCYGLRVDFRGELFPGSAALLALSDEMREARTICHCGKKATMVVRQDAQGRAVSDGAQVLIGGNETYQSLCRRHWREAMGQRPPDT